MSVRRKRANLLGALALAGAFSCSVFPDEATLPVGAGAGSGAAGTPAAGSSGLPEAGMAGAHGVETNAGAGAGPDRAGTSSGGSGVGGAPTGTGGSLDPVAGAAGAGGAAACANPKLIVGAVTADTWIEAAKPKMNHGNDKSLSIVSGGQERRALLQVALPAVPAGAVLLRATLSLHLESNADAGGAARQLEVHQLVHDVLEGRATWEMWSNGNNDWATFGGDFGPVVAEASLAAASPPTTLGFDVTQPAVQGYAAAVAALPFIVLESSTPPLAPADLAFTSREGDASGIPALILEYCEP